MPMGNDQGRRKPRGCDLGLAGANRTHQATHATTVPVLSPTRAHLIEGRREVHAGSRLAGIPQPFLREVVDASRLEHGWVERFPMLLFGAAANEGTNQVG